MSKGKIILLVLVLIGLAAFVTVCNITGWFVKETVEVAKDEFGPRALLEKYEWFKDVAASMDKKIADVKVYETKLRVLEDSYEGVSRKDWDRTDKEIHSQWSQEIAGIKASYNALAAEYNAQMAKFNWRFSNKGALPQGATEPLPREYRPYTTQ